MPPGNTREANEDGGVRTAKTTNLLFSQYVLIFNRSVPFIIFSLKLTNGCKILSFRELCMGR